MPRRSACAIARSSGNRTNVQRRSIEHTRARERKARSAKQARFPISRGRMGGGGGMARSKRLGSAGDAPAVPGDPPGTSNVWTRVSENTLARAFQKHAQADSDVCGGSPQTTGGSPVLPSPSRRLRPSRRARLEISPTLLRAPPPYRANDAVPRAGWTFFFRRKSERNTEGFSFFLSGTPIPPLRLCVENGLSANTLRHCRRTTRSRRDRASRPSA